MAKVDGILPPVHEEYKKMSTKLGEYKGWIQIRLNMDTIKFELCETGEHNSDADYFAQIADTVPEAEHSFYILPSPLEEKFLIVHWGPDGSAVKQRMLYSSSRGSLKDGLGSSNFCQDYFVTEKSDLTLEAFTKARTEDPSVDVRSGEEIIKEAAERESAAMAYQGTTAVMQKLAVQCTDAVTTAVEAFKAGECGTIQLKLNIATMEVDAVQGGPSREDALGLLEKDAASYLVHRYQHQNREGEDATKVIFVYFCPDTAPRKSKFTYSTSKSSVIDLMETLGISIDSKHECTEVADLDVERLLNDIYPRQEKAVVVNKPKAAGRKRGKRRGGKAALAALDS